MDILERKKAICDFLLSLDEKQKSEFLYFLQKSDKAPQGLLALLREEYQE